MKNVHLRVILLNFPTLTPPSGYSGSKNKHVPYKIYLTPPSGYSGSKNKHVPDKIYLSRHMIKFCQVLKYKPQKQ